LNTDVKIQACAEFIALSWLECSSGRDCFVIFKVPSNVVYVSFVVWLTLRRFSVNLTQYFPVD